MGMPVPYKLLKQCFLDKQKGLRIMTTPVPVKKLRPNAKLPTYGSEYAAGADLYACLDSSVTIQPHETFLVPTGLSLELPIGWAGFVHARPV